MNNFEIVYQKNNKTCLNKLNFWARNNENSSYSLYQIEYGYAEKMFFTPKVLFRNREQLLEYMFRAVKLNYFCEEVSELTLSIYDPNVIEFEELTLPAYIIQGDKFIYEDKEITQLYPTKRMLDAAYSYYRRISDSIAEDILNETVFNSYSVYTVLTGINFYPTYYLDNKKFYTYYYRRDNKGISVCIFNKDKINTIEDEEKIIDVHLNNQADVGLFIGKGGKKLNYVRKNIGVKYIVVDSMVD